MTRLTTSDAWTVAKGYLFITVGVFGGVCLIVGVAVVLDVIAGVVR